MLLLVFISFLSELIWGRDNESCDDLDGVGKMGEDRQATITGHGETDNRQKQG